MDPLRDKTAQDTVRLPRDVVAELRRAEGMQPPLSLLIYHQDGAEIVPLRPGVGVVIGRDEPSNVRIQDNRLSREHARFTLADGRVLVEDLESTNGTWMADDEIVRREIGPGDEVLLGGVTVVVHAPAPADGVALGLESHERFRISLEREVVRARYFGRGVGLLMVRASGRPGAHVSRWSPGLRRYLRPVDRFAPYSSDAIEVLLPEADMQAAIDVARAIASGHANGEIKLVVGVATVPEAATAAEKLLELSFRAARRATEASPVEMAETGSWKPGDESPPAASDADPILASAAMRTVYDSVARLARSAIPVLLQGETGTGKEVLARALHRGGPRRDRPMVCVNCAAIPAQLVESTLFGHEKGSFTGATQQQKGVFEAADGGTVLLDEIGELPLAIQAALLRVLETKRITRVGSSREIEVDVRVVAATNRDLYAMCQTGAFRTDLLYRLNAMTLTIPPLRERADDIDPLAERFLRQANEENGMQVRGASDEAMELLRSYPWPGNVRELRNAMERAVVIARGEWIEVPDLPERVRAHGQQIAVTTATQPGTLESVTGPDSDEGEGAEPEVDDPDGGPEAGGGANGIKTQLRDFERQIILAALRKAGWNQTEAARELKMPLRTLVHKMKTMGIKKLGYGAESSK